MYSRVVFNSLAGVLLSILIPTYNRASSLYSTLKSLKVVLESESYPVSLIEVVVADNISADTTREVVHGFSSDYPVDIILKPWSSHVTTAEENVFRSYAECRGVFVWTLCDDDRINPNGFRKLIALLRDQSEADKIDLIITNSTIADENGCIVSPSQYCLSRESISGPLLKMALSLGFWFVLAGFSSTIIRNSPRLTVDSLRNVCKGTEGIQIYSHVFAYIMSLGPEARCLASQWPLVTYKVAEDDIARWLRHSRLTGKFLEYPWTYGFIKLLSNLEVALDLHSPLLFEIVETNGTEVFSPARVILEKLFTQTLSDVKARLIKPLMFMAARPRPMLGSEFAEIMHYFRRIDPDSSKSSFLEILSLIAVYRSTYLECGYLKLLLRAPFARRDIRLLKSKVQRAIRRYGDSRARDFLDSVTPAGRCVYKAAMTRCAIPVVEEQSVRSFFRDPSFLGS